MIEPLREMSWESVAEPLRTITDPSWAHVEAQIRHLETAESGSVFLKAADGSTLSIGGDQGEGYLVFVSDEKGHRYLQAPHSKRWGFTTMAIGFQPAEYPNRIIVDLCAALEAARLYFDIGCIGESEDWTPDGKSIEQE
jgi:hypothetical protein